MGHGPMVIATIFLGHVLYGKKTGKTTKKISRLYLGEPFKY